MHAHRTLWPCDFDFFFFFNVPKHHVYGGIFFLQLDVANAAGPGDDGGDAQCTDPAQPYEQVTI